MDGQTLHAVVLWQDEAAWVEFYWADDAGHAGEQAADAHEYAEVHAVARVPRAATEQASPVQP